VRFAEGLQQLCAKSQPVLLEVGPGHMLSSVAEQYVAGTGARDRLILSSLPRSSDRHPDRAFILRTLGHLWSAGIEPDWAAVHSQERRSRIPLPTYPFERKRYWLERRATTAMNQAAQPLEIAGVEVSANGNESSPQAGVPEKSSGDGVAFGVHERPDMGTELVAPTNEIEQKIVAIWENLLGIRPVGIHDNFLRLGGNSLLAIRVAAELRAAFQIEFPIQALMTASTPAELALVVEDALVTMIEGMNESEVS
jgi:acyl transferase domain-containing protein